MNEVSRNIELITQEIQFYKKQAAESMIEIGNRLLEAKQQLQHGEWGEWLENKVEFSERVAQNFMRIAKEYRNPQLIDAMGGSTSKAIMLLALSPAEREEFVEEKHEIEGEEKTVAEMTTKEMQRLIKEIEEAKEREEALKGQLELFEEEKAEQMAQELTNAVNKIEEENQKLIEKYEERKEEALAAEEAAKEDIEKLKEKIKELEEEKETFSADETEIERIRAEAEEEARKKEEEKYKKKIEKLEKEASKAKKEAKEAEDLINAHEEAQKEAEKRAQEEKEKAEDLRRKLEGAKSDIEVFKVYFGQAQTALNKMVEMMQEDTEDKEKMQKALRALISGVVDQMEGVLSE